jgi:hypothetical protein
VREGLTFACRARDSQCTVRPELHVRKS